MHDTCSGRLHISLFFCQLSEAIKKPGATLNFVSSYCEWQIDKQRVWELAQWKQLERLLVEISVRLYALLQLRVQKHAILVMHFHDSRNLSKPHDPKFLL